MPNVDSLKQRKEQLSDEMDRLTMQMQQLRKTKGNEIKINQIDQKVDELQGEYLKIQDTLKKMIVKEEEIGMSVEKKIDAYLSENFEIDQEAIGDAVSSFTTGMKRVQYKLQRANTPQKYTEAFGMASALVANFPLKSKIIWKMIADEYGTRLGAPSEN